MIRLLLAFAFSYFFFLAAPVLLRVRLGPGPTPTAGAMVDVLTPFVLIGLCFLLYRAKGENRSDAGQVRWSWSGVIFVFFAILFVEGHGIHLSANSIIGFLGQDRGSDAYAITYFYDEVLGHYLWRTGILGLTGILLARHWQGWDERRPGLLALASAAYGLTHAVAAVESQTVLLDLPASLGIAAVFGARWWRDRKLPGDAAFAFFGLAHGIVVVALSAWWLNFGGFPEPSRLQATPFLIGALTGSG